MAVFLDIVLSFPTLVFTIGLALSLLYWFMAILGAVDIEIFDAADGVVDGALDGALEGLDGAFDAMEGALDAVDGAVDAAEGAIEGALDGAGESADAVAEGAVDAASVGLRPLLLLASVFRLGKVPVTVSLSAFVLWGWLIGFVLTWLYLGAPALVPHLVFSVVSMGLAVVGAAALTNVSVRPLEPVFKLHKARERQSLIGEACEITTGRVDATFGQAMARVGSDDLLFQIRCDKPNAMRKGDHALIVSFDPERESYVVEPLAAARIEREPALDAAALANPALSTKTLAPKEA